MKWLAVNAFLYYSSLLPAECNGHHSYHYFWVCTGTNLKQSVKMGLILK